MMYIGRSSQVAVFVFVANWMVSACSVQQVTQPPGEDFGIGDTSLRIEVASDAAASVPDATVVVKVYSPVVPGVLLDTTTGRTNLFGWYLYAERSPREGWYPITISVTPPAESGLLPAEVNDSTEWVYVPRTGPPVTRVVTVTLPTESR